MKKLSELFFYFKKKVFCNSVAWSKLDFIYNFKRMAQGIGEFLSFRNTMLGIGMALVMLSICSSITSSVKFDYSVFGEKINSLLEWKEMFSRLNHLNKLRLLKV